MIVITKSFEIRLYQETSGKIPVLEWLKDFNKEDRKIIDRDIKHTQYSWPWKMPLIKSLGDGLMEIRITLKSK